jgi:hypothetical protein
LNVSSVQIETNHIGGSLSHSLARLVLIEMDEEMLGLTPNVLSSITTRRKPESFAGLFYVSNHSAGAQRQLKFMLSFLRQATEPNSRNSLERLLVQGDPQ